MEALWIVATLLLAGFIGGRFIFSKERLPLLIRDFFLSGWEFILLGVIVGPLGYDLLDQKNLTQIQPVLALVFGWAGLIFGMQMRLEDLKKVDRGLLGVTLIQATLVWWGLFLFFGVVGSLVTPLTGGPLLIAAAVVAAAGSLSSPTLIGLMAPRFGRRNAHLLRRLGLITNLDLGPALIGVGLVFCFFPARLGGEFSFAAGLSLTAYSLLIAFAMAGLFRFFGREHLKQDEDLAVFIGFLVFLSGIAFYLDLSPLFLSLVTGVTLANSLKTDDPVYRLLFATEKPFYVVLLILTGAYWSEANLTVMALVLPLLLLRLWLKEEITGRAAHMLLTHDPLPQNAGLALGAQGALALAIGLNYLLTYPGAETRTIFGVIVLGAILNDILAPFLIHRVMGSYAEEKE